MKVKLLNLASFGIIFLLITITACSPKSKSEDEIKEHIMDTIEDGFSLESFEISKRKTEMENRRDAVWVIYQYSNDFTRVDMETILYYELFNEGWEFVDSEDVSKDVTILSSSVSEDQAREEISGNFSEVEYENRVTHLEYVGRKKNPEQDGIDTLYYKYIEEAGLMKITYNIAVYYKFKNLKWEYDTEAHEIADKSVDKIIGKWSYKGDNIEINLNIIRFNILKNRIKMEYEYKNGQSSEKSDGVEMFETDTHQPSGYEIWGNDGFDLSFVDYLVLELHNLESGKVGVIDDGQGIFFDNDGEKLWLTKVE